MRKFAHSFIDHIARYNLAMQYAYKRDVLDVGSKEGFGAHLMSYCANSIGLLDINPDYLSRAERFYTYFCPATFYEQDLEKGFPDRDWDVMTAFEVIEHVADPDFLIKNMAAHLRPGGLLIFSVPHMVANHEHKTLFDEEKIREVVEKYFDIEEFFVQDKHPISGKPMYKGLKCYVGVARLKETKL